MIILKYPTYEDQIQAISDDMTLNNEAALMNIAVGDGRQYLTTKGSITMGIMPRGDAVNTAFIPTDTSYIQDTYWWEIITPWFVASKGVNHAATNTRINISGITIQIYDTSIGAWRKLPTADGNPTWAYDKDYSNSGNVDHGNSVYRTESDGSWSFQFQSDSAAIHGGSSRFTLTDAIPSLSNIGGVFVKMVSKLVLDDVNGVDDREQAEILMDVAADYWPRIGTTINPNLLPMTYVPNVGISRFGLVGITPRKHFMATITPPTVPASRSAYTLGGGIVTMPVATFNANLPPYIP